MSRRHSAGLSGSWGGKGGAGGGSLKRDAISLYVLSIGPGKYPNGQSSSSAITSGNSFSFFS